MSSIPSGLIAWSENVYYERLTPATTFLARRM